MDPYYTQWVEFAGENDVTLFSFSGLISATVNKDYVSAIPEILVGYKAQWRYHWYFCARNKEDDDN